MQSSDRKSDSELLVASSFNPDSFGELYDRTSKSVLAFFLRRTGCAQTAADLTAETFASAYDSRRRYRDTGAPAQAWLFTIARRQLARFVRRARVEDRARRRLGIERLVLGDEDIDRVEQLVDFGPTRELLHDAVETLSESERSAVQLRIHEGLAYSDIATRLACSEAAARVRVSRALSRLAAQIGDP